MVCPEQLARLVGGSSRGKAGLSLVRPWRMTITKPPCFSSSNVARAQLRELAEWRFQSRSRGRTRGGFSSALLLRRSIITNETNSRNLRMIACVRLALVSLPPSDDAAGSLLSPEIDPTKQTSRRVRPNSDLNGHTIDYE